MTAAQVTSAQPRTARRNTHKHNGTLRGEPEEENCPGAVTSSIAQPTDAGLLARTQRCLGLRLHPTAFDKANRPKNNWG